MRQNPVPRRPSIGPIAIGLLLAFAFFAAAPACGQPVVTISPPTLPNGTVGVAYNQTLSGSGGLGSYGWTVSSGVLPTGLSLSSGFSKSAQIFGTPSAAGSFTFTITATDDSNNRGSQPYTVAICPASISLSPSSLPGGTQGVGYNQTITASPAGSYSFSVTAGALPPGLTLGSSGIVSGTPSATGTFNFTVTATDINGCTGSGAYSISVVAGCSAPAAPRLGVNPSVASVGQRVTLTWNATIASGQGSYRIQVSVNGRGFSDVAVVPASASSTMTFVYGLPLTPGNFDFRVLAEPSCNPGLFATSNTARVVSGAPCPNAPQVTGVTVSPAAAVAGSPFTVTWNPVFGFSGSYSVLLSTDGGQSFHQIGTAETTSFTGTVDGSPGTTLTFVVEAQECIYSPLSNFATLTVLPSGPTCDPPGAVSDIQIRAVDVTPARPPSPTEFIQVSWTPPASGTAPVGYGVRINGGPEVFVAVPNAVLPPRGEDLDPIQAFVKAQACNPVQSGPEVASDPVALFLTPPQSTFTVSANPRVGDGVLFTDTSSPQATSWLWVFDDGTAETVQSPSHTFPTAGPHPVSLVASNSAGSSSSTQVVTVAPAGSSRVSPATAIPIDASNPGRRRARVEIPGPDAVHLRIQSGEPGAETVVFARFLDPATQAAVFERRLSIPAGAEAIYDLGAYGRTGRFVIELVSDQIFQASLWSAGRPAVHEVER